MSVASRSTVKILNSLPGGSNYTSLKNARRFVQRGLAAWAIIDVSLRFDYQSRERDMVEAERRMRQPWRILDDDKAVDQLTYRALPWNGADQREGEFHRPFESSVFPRFG